MRGQILDGLALGGADGRLRKLHGEHRGRSKERRAVGDAGPVSCRRKGQRGTERTHAVIVLHLQGTLMAALAVVSMRPVSRLRAARRE